MKRFVGFQYTTYILSYYNSNSYTRNPKILLGDLNIYSTHTFINDYSCIVDWDGPLIRAEIDLFKVADDKSASSDLAIRVHRGRF